MVLLDLLFVELRRVVREAQRIVRRVSGYGELPVLARLARVGDDVDQVTAALDRVAPLVERARRAFDRIRRPRQAQLRPYGPFVPKGSDASNGTSAG